MLTLTHEDDDDMIHKQDRYHLYSGRRGQTEEEFFSLTSTPKK